MAWAIFRREFNFDYRPTRPISQFVRPLAIPQQFPERLIAAAVRAGAAVRVPSPRPEQAREYKRIQLAIGSGWS